MLTSADSDTGLSASVRGSPESVLRANFPSGQEHQVDVWLSTWCGRRNDLRFVSILIYRQRLMYGSSCQGKNKTGRMGTEKSRGRVIWGEWTQNVKLFLTRAKALQRSCIAEEILNNPGAEMLIALQVGHPLPSHSCSCSRGQCTPSPWQWERCPPR